MLSIAISVTHVNMRVWIFTRAWTTTCSDTPKKSDFLSLSSHKLLTALLPRLKPQKPTPVPDGVLTGWILSKWPWVLWTDGRADVFGQMSLPHSSSLPSAPTPFLPTVLQCSLSLRWGMLTQMFHPRLSTQLHLSLRPDMSLSALTTIHRKKNLIWPKSQAAQIYQCKQK